MKLLVNHNLIQAIGDGKEILKLQKILSFKIEGGEYSQLYKRGIWDGYHHFLFKRFNRITKRFEYLFRTGLLNHVIGESCDHLDIEDKRKYDFKFDLSHLDNLNLRTNKGVSQLKGIKLAIKNKIGIWHCATNFGKSRMAIGLLKTLSYSNKVNTAIFTHSDLIKKQLLSDEKGLKKYCDKKDIGEISSGIFNPRLITVCMMPTISRAIKGKDKKKFIEFLSGLSGYIADECHRGNSKTFTKPMDYCLNSKIRIGMSGTPLYKDTLNNFKLIERVGEVIYSVKNEALIEKGISAKPTVIITTIKIKGKYPDEFSSWKSRKLKYQYALNTWIINNKKLLKAINEITVSEINNNNDTLIVTNRKIHAVNIQKRLSKNKIKCLYLAGEIKNDDREKVLKNFKVKKKMALISLPVIDEGVDIDNIKALILSAGGKSSRQLLQRIGRSLRKKKTDNTVRIYDFKIKDPIAKVDGTRFLYDHFQERLKVYKQEEFEIIYR